MDHLPSVQDPVFPPLEVPYLCQQDYDDLGFWSYPERKGWDMARIMQGDFTEHPQEDTASFLQAWLYFGLLSHVIDQQVDLRSFVRLNSDGRRVITTVHLAAVQDKWFQRIKSYEEPFQKRLQLWTEAHDTLTQIAKFVVPHLSKPKCPLGRSIVLSIQILGASLANQTWPNLHESFSKVPNKLIFLCNASWGESELVKARFLDQGFWCRNDYAKLTAHMGLIGQFYTSNLRREIQGAGHTKCSKMKCIADNIDESTYQTKHADGCGGQGTCMHVGPSIELVKLILAKGEIPILRLSAEGMNGDFHLDVVPYRWTMRYVALSHVWSDGLGNVFKNTLPVCQLRKLAPLMLPLLYSKAGQGREYPFIDDIFRRILGAPEDRYRHRGERIRQ